MVMLDAAYPAAFAAMIAAGHEVARRKEALKHGQITVLTSAKLKRRPEGAEAAHTKTGPRRIGSQDPARP